LKETMNNLTNINVNLTETHDILTQLLLTLKNVHLRQTHPIKRSTRRYRLVLNLKHLFLKLLEHLQLWLLLPASILKAR
jgi:hypothetical protein